MNAPMTPDRAALEAKVYDSLVSFNGVACWDILRLAQMRRYLAEHLAADLAPELDRLRARVAELETAVAHALAPHVKHQDSPHCVADGDPWPCPTVTTLAPAGWPLSDGPARRDLRPGAEAARRMIRDRQVSPVEVLAHDVAQAIAPLTGDARTGADMVLTYLRTQAAPVPALRVSPWESAVAGLNALVDANIAFWIEPDGHISGPFGDEHIEWDQQAARWRLVHDDEDEANPPALPEDPHDSPLHHTHETSRDLPEVPWVDPARCLDVHPFTPRDGWRLTCDSCDHAEGAPCHRRGGAS